MDGLENNDGVIVVATTNDLGAIEPALAERPSRFDVVLEVGLPDGRARRRILQQNLRQQAVADEGLVGAVVATEGCTGAQVREIAFLAVQQAILRESVNVLGLAQVDECDLRAAAERATGKPKRGPIGFRRAALPE